MFSIRDTIVLQTVNSLAKMMQSPSVSFADDVKVVGSSERDALDRDTA